MNASSGRNSESIKRQQFPPSHTLRPAHPTRLVPDPLAKGIAPEQLVRAVSPRDTNIKTQLSNPARKEPCPAIIHLDMVSST